MSTLTTTRNYLDGDDLTQAELDAAFDSIETWANGNIGTANIATNGVDSAQLAASSVIAAKIASDAVTTAKILDSAVTGAKLDSGVVDNSTLAYSTSILKVKDGGVGTTQLAAAAVTQAKRAALGQQISSTCGNYSTTSTSYVAITNLSVSLTTTGRPVWIGLVSDGTGVNSALSFQSSGGGGSNYQIKEGTTVIANALVDISIGGGSSDNIFVPVGSLWHIYVPSAGTYTYTVEGKVSGGSGTTTLYCQQAKLVAFEL